MCYEFRLHQAPGYRHSEIQTKRGRFGSHWNSICGKPVPVFEQRRSDGGVATGEKTSLLSFFNLDYANNLCTILGYQHVWYYHAYFGMLSQQSIHIMHRQYTDPSWDMYPDFDCHSRSGVVGLNCLSKLFLLFVFC